MLKVHVHPHYYLLDTRPHMGFAQWFIVNLKLLNKDVKIAHTGIYEKQRFRKFRIVGNPNSVQKSVTA